jgi:glycosyltransferase involved in cell wall biosynthesis
LCISSETINFVRDFYSCPEKFIEYFPLGGVIPSDAEYFKKRKQIRKQYNLEENTLVFLQTGKFDKKKKLKESILAFKQVSHFSRIKFLIAGVFLEDEAEILELISQDTRIEYLGWKSAADLYDLLCAIDIYLQPGSQSATLQNSICCRCAVIVDDVISHKPFVKNNGWLLNESSSLSEVLAQAMQKFEKNTLQIMKNESLKIAYDLLDYSKQAQRLLK